MYGRVPTMLAAILGTCLTMNACAQQTELPQLGDELTDAQVSAFADLALSGLSKEFPNKPSNVMVDQESVLSPQQMHPAFYGCFDWHSSVHGHWMLVRLIRLYPQHEKVTQIRQQLNDHLTATNLDKEAEYFQQKHNRNFERMYGWAWFFRLVAELEQWDDPQGNEWRDNLKSLEKILQSRVDDYLPKLSFPIRTGVHPDTAFALGQILDYARITNNSDLEQLIVARSRDYYLNDKDYPSDYEPSGEDFFSPGLNEADLMRRVLNQEEFSQWLSQFMPSLGQTNDHRLLEPVEVSDVTDGKIVHLAGLDLSRAWCFQGVAHALAPDDSRRDVLMDAARDHASTGFKYVFSGHYEGEHWLATFAVYTLTRVGVEHP